MGKINNVLKWLFIFFNGMFAVFGCVLVFATFKATAYDHQLSSMGSPGLIWSWLFSFAILGISCLGIFAAYKEKILLLKIFAGFMGVGMIIMFIFGFIMVSAKNKMTTALESVSDDVVELVMRDEEMKSALHELQPYGQCCGVKRATDWGNSIPITCECTHEHDDLEFLGLGPSNCEAKPLDHTGPDQIYTRPCRVVILVVVNFVFKVMMGIFFGLGVTAFLGLLLSLLMLHQVKRHQGVGGASMGLRPY